MSDSQRVVEELARQMAAQVPKFSKVEQKVLEEIKALDGKIQDLQAVETVLKSQLANNQASQRILRDEKSDCQSSINLHLWTLYQAATSETDKREIYNDALQMFKEYILTIRSGAEHKHGTKYDTFKIKDHYSYRIDKNSGNLTRVEAGAKAEVIVNIIQSTPEWSWISIVHRDRYL